jgi:hypothetical protein
MSQAQLFAVAVVGLLAGPAMALRPYELARFSEVLDAIGRKPAGRVEPAAWKVTLTRLFGVALSVAGGAAAVTFVV